MPLAASRGRIASSSVVSPTPGPPVTTATWCNAQKIANLYEFGHRIHEHLRSLCGEPVERGRFVGRGMSSAYCPACGALAYRAPTRAALAELALRQVQDAWSRRPARIGFLCS